MLHGARNAVGGLAREAVSVGVTAALWPFGFADRGTSEIQRHIISRSLLRPLGA